MWEDCKLWLRRPRRSEAVKGTCRQLRDAPLEGPAHDFGAAPRKSPRAARSAAPLEPAPPATKASHDWPVLAGQRQLGRRLSRRPVEPSPRSAPAFAFRASPAHGERPGAVQTSSRGKEDPPSPSVRRDLQHGAHVGLSRRYARLWRRRRRAESNHRPDHSPGTERRPGCRREPAVRRRFASALPPGIGVTKKGVSFLFLIRTTPTPPYMSGRGRICLQRTR